MASIKCGCGKLNWMESGGGTCVACGAAFAAQKGSVAVAVASYTSPRSTCESCRNPRPESSDSCVKCGWDAKVRIRYCTECRGVCGEDCAFDGDNLGFLGTGAGIGAIIMFKLFGILGTLVIIVGLSAIGSFVNALTLKYQCHKCKRQVPLELLAEDDRKGLSSARVKYLVMTGVLGLLAIGGLVLWVMLVVWLTQS